VLEPIRAYLARKRIARLRRRLDWLKRNAAGDEDLHRADIEALQWAIDELVALYTYHERNGLQ
jgi:hypothetical protein